MLIVVPGVRAAPARGVARKRRSVAGVRDGSPRALGARAGVRVGVPMGAKRLVPPCRMPAHHILCLTAHPTARMSYEKQTWHIPKLYNLCRSTSLHKDRMIAEVK
jgi:hypothetical protein